MSTSYDILMGMVADRKRKQQSAEYARSFIGKKEQKPKRTIKLIEEEDSIERAPKKQKYSHKKEDTNKSIPVKATPVKASPEKKKSKEDSDVEEGEIVDAPESSQEKNIEVDEPDIKVKRVNK
jgi:hypothetical protein